MNITVGGKSAPEPSRAVVGALTGRDLNAMACMRTKRAAADTILAEVREMDHRLAQLDRTLADPALADHPKRQGAENEALRLAGRRLLWLKRINETIDDVVLYWYRLTPAAMREAYPIWGIHPLTPNPAWDCWRWEGLDYAPPGRWSTTEDMARTWDRGLLK